MATLPTLATITIITTIAPSPTLPLPPLPPPFRYNLTIANTTNFTTTIITIKSKTALLPLLLPP
jgi:hypothetical protein